MKFIKLRKRTIVIAVTAILIIGGLVGTVPTLYFKWTNDGTAHGSAGPFAYADPTPANIPQPTLISGYPVDINIPSLIAPENREIPVVPGVYDAKTGTWNVSLSDAQYATPSVLPNNLSGNTVIYGHYRPEVFAYLHLIKPGAMATVTTSNGYVFTYKYVGTYAISPTDTTVFDYKGGPILTVQTCSGEYFQNRQMYQFDFVSYAQA